MFEAADLYYFAWIVCILESKQNYDNVVEVF